MFNLLKKPTNSLTARKNRLMWALIVFCGLLACFSVASASNFIQISLEAYSIPTAISIVVGISIAILVDIVLGDSLQQISIDYFNFKSNPDQKRWIEPITLIIALSFGALSWYMSQEGSDLKSKSKQIEIAQSDTTTSKLLSILSSPLTTIPGNVKKTEDMNWTEHAQLLKDKDAAIEKNKAEQKRLEAAKSLVNLHNKNNEKLNSNIESIFDQNANTLLILLILYSISNLFIGYYKSSSIPSNSPAPTLSDPIQQTPGEPIKNTNAQQRAIGFIVPPKDITHDQQHVLHDFRVTTENQEIKNDVRICENCGSTFDPNHKKQKFCGDKCRYDHHNKSRKK
jgi:ribosomal protein S27AE